MFFSKKIVNVHTYLMFMHFNEYTGDFSTILSLFCPHQSKRYNYDVSKLIYSKRCLNIKFYKKILEL